MMAELFGESEDEEMRFESDNRELMHQSEAEVPSSDEEPNDGVKQKRKRDDSDISSDEESNKRQKKDDSGDSCAPETSPFKRIESQSFQVPSEEPSDQSRAAASDSSDGPENEKSNRKGSSGKSTEDEVDGETVQRTAHDLFGEDVGDISSDSENEENEANVVKTTGNEAQDEEPQEEQLPLYTMKTSQVPRIVTNLDKNAFHFVKLPNFLSIVSRPYDPRYYEDEIDEDEVTDQEGRARLKLKIENTIRWRQTTDENGNLKRESNARIVRWSDGSMSLHLGSEVFDIFQQKLMADDHNHVFLRHADGLQGQGVFKTKLTFRPQSINSSTHRKMLLSLSDRDQKFHKIQMLPEVGHNPEANRTERIKKEEENLRAAMRRENARKRMTRRPSRFNSPYQRNNRDEEDEEGAVSLSSIKNKYKKRMTPNARSNANEERSEALDTANDDDDSDLDYFDRKVVSKGKNTVLAVEESDED